MGPRELRAALEQAGAGQEAQRLAADLQAGRYRPQGLLHRTRRKPDGGVRRLGVPRPRDMAVQRAAVQLAGPALDRRLLPGCHGFRRGHSVGTAIRHLVGRPADAILVCDIERLFDSLGPHHLQRARALSAARWWRHLLSVQARCWRPVVPQGAPLSPMIANHALHSTLDVPLERAGLRWARYGDDLVVLLPRRSDLPSVLGWLAGLCRRDGLALHPRKTRATHRGGPPGVRVLGHVLGVRRGHVELRQAGW